mmetsp:Transcript_13959/g.33766  ORF Transcript_13959/g.33766 Transcript_13959/m.33766 type:complete len:255 (+) Transcript_13959:874-1638(+)
MIAIISGPVSVVDVGFSQLGFRVSHVLVYEGRIARVALCVVSHHRVSVQLLAAARPAATRSSSSALQPRSRASSSKPASQSPRYAASRVLPSPKLKPLPPPTSDAILRVRSSISPTSSRLTSSRGVSSRGWLMSPAKGCTPSDVPATISRSHRGKSCAASWLKRAGRFSPKKTMSGLTSASHQGTPHCSGVPASTARRTSATSASCPARQCAASKLPCAATMRSAGSPAAASSESMFCVKHRSSSPLSCSRRMK